MEIKTLNQAIIEDIGKVNIEKTKISNFIINNLNPTFDIRPYQIKSFQFYLNYWNKNFRDKPLNNHQLLFHMATGSGKTLIIAGIILDLYARGYRNFLFFVNSTNIIDKTRNNFLNPQSLKYLFAPQLKNSNKQFLVKEINNFQASNINDINIVFSTIQALHIALNNPSENALTYEDFESQKIVLISDEAHHINAVTKNKNKIVLEGVLENSSWENTVQRIFKSNTENILLEFTATLDFANNFIAKKYNPCLIFDYKLKNFREDGYSKEVNVLQTDLLPFQRALQAVLLSQYRRKIFEKNKLNIKPIILFKSKTIKESKAFFEEFKVEILHLTEKKVSKVLNTNHAYLKEMKVYLNINKITLQNLIEEIQNDFSEDKLIEVNSKEESEEKQIILNSLEEVHNEYRAVFAVDKLNEGWDVLNLFDIVRVYDTRDSKAGKPGKTTISEAQLIGRGARYCPFKLMPEHFLDKRKFDNDLNNELRICEELIYHSAYNPKYIQELKFELYQNGIIANENKVVDINVKESFKSTILYQTGKIFFNHQEKYHLNDIHMSNKNLIKKLYKVNFYTGQSQFNRIFDKNSINESFIKVKQKDYLMYEFGINILRKAIQCLYFYKFDNLKIYLPNLLSIQEFITSPNYIKNIKIEVSGDSKFFSHLSSSNKLFIVIKVLEEISDKILSNVIEYKGSKDFTGYPLKKCLVDKKINFAMDRGQEAEYGKSMSTESARDKQLNLKELEWFPYNDFYGTSEEKLLIKYIDRIYDKLKENYKNVYLIRNDWSGGIYSFDEGKKFEPDFILYLQEKSRINSKYYQIFIEAKGDHLLKHDEWKQIFLLQLQNSSLVKLIHEDNKYTIWGLPFFNAKNENEFDKAFLNKFILKER